MTIKDEAAPESEPTAKTTEIIEKKEDKPASIYSPSANKIERETTKNKSASASEPTADPAKKKRTTTLPIPAASRPTTAATTKQVFLDDCLGHCFACCCYCCCICLFGEAP